MAAGGWAGTARARTRYARRGCTGTRRWGSWARSVAGGPLDIERDPVALPGALPHAQAGRLEGGAHLRLSVDEVCQDEVPRPVIRGQRGTPSRDAPCQAVAPGVGERRLDRDRVRVHAQHG